MGVGVGDGAGFASYLVFVGRGRYSALLGFYVKPYLFGTTTQ